MISDQLRERLGEELAGEVEAALGEARRDTALRYALAGEVHDPDDVLPLLELEGVEVDEHGTWSTSIDGLLIPLRQAKPYLFKDQQAQQPPALKGARPAPAPGSTPPQSYTAQELGALSMEEYRAYRAQQFGFPKN